MGRPYVSAGGWYRRTSSTSNRAQRPPLGQQRVAASSPERHSRARLVQFPTVKPRSVLDPPAPAGLQVDDRPELRQFRLDLHYQLIERAFRGLFVEFAGETDGCQLRTSEGGYFLARAAACSL
jgi:hypothetical protein